MRLILVRHGQTASNVVHALDTRLPGAPLTPLGQKQAASLVLDLIDESIAFVAASPMLRAQQTAAPLAASRGLPVQTLDGLREIDAGELNMHATPAAIERYLTVAFSWASGDLLARLPGGPSAREVLSSFDAAVEVLETAALQSAVPCAAAISHGAAIRTWVGARSTNVDASFVATRTLANAGVVTLEGCSTEGWRVLSWADCPSNELPVSGVLDAGAAEGPTNLAIEPT